jgi:hypothetical protein
MNWDRLIGEAIYLDTNIVILAVESHEPKFRVLRSLFEEFDRDKVRAVATARLAGCGHFLTQDERLGRAINDEPHWFQIPESA